MSRKLAYASVTLNVVFLFTALYALPVWLLDMLKPFKVELPAPVLWMISASEFVRSPVGFVVIGGMLMAAYAVRTRQVVK